MLNSAIFEFRPFIMVERHKFLKMQEIESIVLLASGLDKYQFRSRTRLRKVLVWRQLFYIVCRAFDYPTTSIGAYLRFNHATVIHGSNAAKKQLETDPVYRQLLVEKLPPYIWAKIKPKAVIK